ncbi:unnamed protein product [Scytosiphon promiscuus]
MSGFSRSSSYDGRSGVGAEGLCGRWPWGSSANDATLDDTSAWGRQQGGQDESENFTSGVRRIWQRPAHEGSLCKDLPRLARRITIRTRRGVTPPDPSYTQHPMGPEETWALIAHLTSTLVYELEPERAAEIDRGLANIATRVTATTDLEMVVPELIRLLGGDGKALRALKMVDQGVVLLGVHHMKGGVTRGLLTKDVRSADGWQIGMDVFDQYVQVYHTRREQSVDDVYAQSVHGVDNHFELDFEVRATFDRGMTQLTAAGLRVQRLVCSPTMQPEMRVQLESRILGDLIIL